MSPELQGVNLSSKTDVLIVGAGPTGLALCAELHRLGIQSLIIDRLAEGANTSRALVIQARTLEVLEALGVAPRLLRDGIKVPFFRIRDRDKVLISIDFRDIPSTYAFTLMCPQVRTEAILLERLHELGGHVLRPAEMKGLELTADGARVQIEADGSTRTVHARWVVGCDGMHSSVRELAGIPFEGSAMEESFVLLDGHIDWPFPRDEVSLFFSPAGLVVVAPMPDDLFRVVATMEEAPPHPSASEVQELLTARGPQAHPAQIQDKVWSSRFKISQRAAQSPRKGCVLLCGDASHVHSPAGGQGMNTGIQDSISLAAALADVLKGADEVKLDEWASKRHQVAEGVLNLTGRLTQMATLRSPAGRKLRNTAIGLAAHIPLLGRAQAKILAELNTR